MVEVVKVRSTGQIGCAKTFCQEKNYRVMHSIVENIVANFERLLKGDEIDLYKAGISADFEYVALWLFKSERPYFWYDGVNDLQARHRKTRQIEFSGEMWVADDSKNSNQWLEPFSARVTDMRNTQQGLRISMDIGEFHATRDLLDYPEPKPHEARTIF